MLRDSKAFSGFPVNDLNTARTFYASTLELDVSEDREMDMLTVKMESGKEVIIYAKPSHEPTAYTMLTFPVDDVDEAVDWLGRRGIRFEENYADLETDERGIHRSEGPVVAWFRDPAGNILSVLETD